MNVTEDYKIERTGTALRDFLQDTTTDPALAKIEEAFSVEAVTKEFFAKYVELFGDINAALEKLVAKDKKLRDEFKAKGVNTVDFAKKLMGQIVFLYFHLKVRLHGRRDGTGCSATEWQTARMGTPCRILAAESRRCM